ncbi:hypothetical protein MUP77_12355 [Candidatus Bathyarchaeota archaeon]|nr:hypothetical protein [Candidatus Bathyarchaeota archaeon]
MPMDKYRGISLQRGLVDTIENYIKAHSEMGYKSLADFATDAIREKCEKLGVFTPQMIGPPLEHFNISEHGVRVLDRTIGNGTARGRIIDVYFTPETVLCEYCDSSSCRHVQFALSIPAVQKIGQEKGWKHKE